MPSQEEHDQLLKENERLKLENQNLLKIARKLQEEKNAYQKVADILEKKVDQAAIIQKRFICKYELMKIGVREIIGDAPEKRAELVHRLKDWLNSQQPSFFLRGSSLEVEKGEEELVNAISSLLVTLEKTGEDSTSSDSTTVTSSEDVEEFIKSVDAGHEESQKFAKSLKEKMDTVATSTISTPVPSEKSGSYNNNAAEQDGIFIKWEPLEEKTEGTTEDPEVTAGSSKDQFILVRVPDGKGEKAEWKYAVAKLLRQAKMSKKGSGESIGKIYKVDYYKRQVSWDSFQPFKLYENKKGFVIDEGDIVLKLPAPFNSSGQRLVRFDFNFKDYNVPY